MLKADISELATVSDNKSDEAENISKFALVRKIKREVQVILPSTNVYNNQNMTDIVIIIFK